jgi:hypothetical protein
MSLLATLRAKKQNRAVATLPVATDATVVGVQPPTVARVAPVTVARPQKTPWAANDPATPAPVTDPDLWCWPHTHAMNTTEVDTFMARLARFTDKGLSHDEAERLADALVIRDREVDDRRLCLECIHLQGFGRWRCGNWQAADVGRQGLARDLVRMLQRCGGFQTTQVRQGANDGKR